MKATAIEPFRPTTHPLTGAVRIHHPILLETDGGSTDGAEFAVHTDERYGYRLAYPGDWSAEPDVSGVALESHQSRAGAAVFVETGGIDPATCAASFLAELADDDHVHGLELLAHRERRVDRSPGVLVECAYTGDSGERWRLSYLFVRDDHANYTLGVDWNDATGFETTAERIVASFSLDPIEPSRTTNQCDHE